MNKNLSKKDENLGFNKRNPFILSITTIIIAIITAITLVGCNNSSENSTSSKDGMSSEVVLNAWENTFELSNNQINEIFGFDEFSKTIENGTYTMSLHVPALETSLKLSNANKSEGQLKLDVLGINFLDLCSNLKECFITSDLVDGKLYTINYEELFESDLEAKEMFLYMLENEDAINTILKNYLKDLVNKYEEILKDASFEELSKIKQEIDGKEVTLEGARISLTEKDIAEMLIYTLEKTQEDEFIKAYLAFNLSDVYYSINDALEYIEAELQRNIDDLQEYLNSKKIFMTIDSYLYDGYVAKSEIEIIDNKSKINLIITYETKGGSYPLENATFNIAYDDLFFELSTFGENTNEIFKLGLAVNIDGTENFELYFEYDKNTNAIILSDGYDSFEGIVNKLNPGKELSLSFNIYGTDVEFNFVDTANIQALTGDYINVLELTDEEIDELADEILNNFYMILFSLLYGF